MSFFKAYDMRGTFGADFDLDTVNKIGRALPRVVTTGVASPRWLVGRDCRETSGSIRDALVRGLVEAGAEVTDLGLCSTPMVYFFTSEDGYDGSVMVTASHNPPSDNGLKVSKRTALPVGYADGLDAVERIVSSGAAAPSAHGGSASDAAPDSLARYIAWQRAHAAPPAEGTLRYAVDCTNGMSALIARQLFPGALVLNEQLDGRFPSHSPNPLDPAAREQLSEAVRENALDCGIIFDGDADRAMFVDEHGDFVQPDYLIPVVAKATLKASGSAAAKVIHDVRTSRGAIEAIREMGCEPVMVPVGHAFAKPALRKIGALCGGELAGHYYFSEFAGCDSGALAALRVLSEIAVAKAHGIPFSSLVGAISRRYANSGELNFRVEDKDAAIARAMGRAAAELPRELSRSEMDGVRIEYAEGWINIRKSNTEPYLRLIAECDTPERLADWVRVLSDAIGG